MCSKWSTLGVVKLEERQLGMRRFIVFIPALRGRIARRHHPTNSHGKEWGCAISSGCRGVFMWERKARWTAARQRLWIHFSGFDACALDTFPISSLYKTSHRGFLHCFERVKTLAVATNMWPRGVCINRCGNGWESNVPVKLKTKINISFTWRRKTRDVERVCVSVCTSMDCINSRPLLL